MSYQFQNQNQNQNRTQMNAKPTTNQAMKKITVVMPPMHMELIAGYYQYLDSITN